MNALVLHSPRGLTRPRTQIVRRAHSESAVVKPLLTAVARTVRRASALAARTPEEAPPHESASRWVSSNQIESSEPPVQSDLPEPQSEPKALKVRRSSLLDIFD